MTTRDPQSTPVRKKSRRLRRKLPDKLIIPQEAEEFRVQGNEVGMRLDQFLKARLKWRSRAKVQALLVERIVTSAGVRLDRAYRLKAADTIRVPLLPPPVSAFRIGEIPLEILYEDDLLVIVNKQPNLVVHPAGKHRYNTLINALHLRYRNLENAQEDIIPKLAHRIDRDTSGVLVALKTRRHERGVPVVFQHVSVRKEYLTLVEGAFEDDAGVITLPLGRDPNRHPDSALRIVTPDGSAAKTGYEVVERFPDFTLVRCRLFTGRQHQIRVHMQAVGHPVVCDKLYGKRAELRLSDTRSLRAGEEDTVLLDRQALHAARLTFPHPVTKEPLTMEAPLPADMQRALEALRAR